MTSSAAPGSSPKRRHSQRWKVDTPSVTATPIASPATATHRKVSEAFASEKVPVITAATAKRKQTRPDASLSSDSPSRMCISRLGIGAREAIELTATGSVGEMIAASAKATASGITGIIQ